MTILQAYAVGLWVHIGYPAPAGASRTQQTQQTLHEQRKPGWGEGRGKRKAGAEKLLCFIHFITAAALGNQSVL